jgi:hypothetical protein
LGAYVTYGEEAERNGGEPNRGLGLLGGGADELGLGPRRTKAERANPRSCGGEDEPRREERRASTRREREPGEGSGGCGRGAARCGDLMG